MSHTPPAPRGRTRRETSNAETFKPPANKGRFYGIGSNTGRQQEDESPPPSTTYMPARKVEGPDYSGFGSAPAAGSSGGSGVDLSDVAFAAGEKMSKAKEWFGEQTENWAVKIKGFLDEL
eukprot:Sspe_Gene.39912::Locus_19233_Transcript_1_1_Confidence_1.000_Length_1329::g.39912::m.39912